MKKPIAPLEARQGDSFTQSLLVSTNFPLDGKTGRLQVRQNPTSPVLLTFSTADNTIALGATVTVNDTTGTPRQVRTVVLSQTAAAMALVPVGVYEYDLEFAQGTQNTTILEGSFTVQKQITRA